MNSIPRKFDNLSIHKKHSLFSAIYIFAGWWVITPVIIRIVSGMGDLTHLSMLLCWGIPLVLFVCFVGAME